MKANTQSSRGINNTHGEHQRPDLVVFYPNEGIIHHFSSCASCLDIMLIQQSEIQYTPKDVAYCMGY